MASSQLSPKKYIETRARALPIYKCLVTKGWKEAGEADVIVMRRHVNGNVTVGFYLVDLMCLGVKDTFYLFNEPESEVYDRLPTNVTAMFDEVDYSLAHNIVYAGHDFALDFGIEPAKEFATTKHILEEDNDNIPLIDIPVGDEDGLPHLIVLHPGEYSNVLAKLQKNAGEGNFRYTITGIPQNDLDQGEDFDEDEDLENDDNGSSIDEYKLGEITPLEVQYVSYKDLYDEKKTEGREDFEILNIILERSLRSLRYYKPEYFGINVEDTEEYKLIEATDSYAYGVSKEEEDHYAKLLKYASENKQHTRYSSDVDLFSDWLQKYADKLLVVATVFEEQVETNGELLSLAKSRLEDLQAYPLARLELALANLLLPFEDTGFEDIYNERDIRKLFGNEHLGLKDLAAFWLIQIVVSIKREDIKSAIHYYYLFAETDIPSLLLSSVQLQLLDAIDKVLEKIENDDQKED